MTRDETITLLRARRALSAQVYDDDAVDAWFEALEQWGYEEVRGALIMSARDEKRITVAHLVERLRPRNYPTRTSTRYTCLRCRERPAVPGRIRCATCQASVDENGVDSPAMRAAIDAAHKRLP